MSVLFGAYQGEISKVGLQRRELLRIAAGAVGAGLLGGAGAGSLAAAERAHHLERWRRRGKVDIHVHLGQPWNERGELTPRMLLEWMDQHGVEQAVILPLISPEAWFYPITSEWVLKETKPFRDRLIPFCAVDPRTAVMAAGDQFTDILKRYRDAGAVGMGEHKWGGAIDDPKNIALMRACAAVEFPVLFHLDNDRNWDKPGLPGLEKLLQEVPDVKLIGHGPGWWASISAEVNQGDLHGYPKGPVKPGGALDRLLTKYPNLYGDLSAGSGHSAIRRDLEFGKAFLLRHADRMIFGTDYLADKQVVEQFALFEEMALPGDVEEKIFRSNARKLLGLEKVGG
jgi:predicted TIM-barrel fold metal-dependent hydrolase